MRLFITTILLFVTLPASAWYRNGFEPYGSPWADLGSACAGVCDAFNGSVTVCEVSRYHPDGITPSRASVNCSAGGGGTDYLNNDLCVAPEVYDANLGKCAVPTNCPSGSFTVEYAAEGLVSSTVCATNSAGYQCTGTQAGPGLTTPSGLISVLYNYTGAECSPDSNGTGGPAPTPSPDPVEPITPTPAPESPVTDDGNTTPEPATDENQEQISKQLEGIQKQLINLEKGSANETQTGNQGNSLLSEILNEVKEQGKAGDGTGDGDGDGTDDAFGDGGCLGPPTCNGPAIECAIAAQAYATRCNLQDETQDITEQDVMGQVGATQTLEQYFDSSNPDNIIDVTGSFTAPAETTSSCPGDYSLATQFGTFNISYSYMCSFGYTVRPVVLLAAWIISGLMFYAALMRDW